jgi:hypothetical protein
MSHQTVRRSPASVPRNFRFTATPELASWTASRYKVLGSDGVQASHRQPTTLRTRVMTPPHAVDTVRS